MRERSELYFNNYQLAKDTSRAYGIDGLSLSFLSPLSLSLAISPWKGCTRSLTHITHVRISYASDAVIYTLFTRAGVRHTNERAQLSRSENARRSPRYRSPLVNFDETDDCFSCLHTRFLSPLLVFPLLLSFPLFLSLSISLSLSCGRWSSKLIERVTQRKEHAREKRMEHGRVVRVSLRWLDANEREL